MIKAGDEKKGYTIDFTSIPQVLKLKVWGMWDEALAEKYKVDMLAAYPHFEGKTWFVLADISQFPPQKAAVQQAHGEMMGKAVQAGMIKAASLVESSLNKMQINRIAHESGMSELAFHTTEQSALEWLRS
jgi:hypothetical protein